MSAVLDIVGRPELLGGAVVASIEERIEGFEDEGSVVMWPHFNDSGFDPYCDVIIQPNRMLAATFIPGNGFSAGGGSGSQGGEWAAGPQTNLVEDISLVKGHMGSDSE